MNNDLRVAIERARQNRAARALETTRATPRQTATDRSGAGPFVAGDRVFDTVSGTFGEVIHAARENVIVPVTD